MAQVEKTFHSGVIALRNMNLTVNEGDFVSLLGPSGCGKSTALKLVTGLMQPTSGRIDWAGEDGAGEKGAGDLGVVFQEPTLMPWARVMDNVYLPFRIRGVPFAEVRDEVLEVLRLVGLEKFQRAFPRELSGGMKMRVSIARALVTKPRLILMDEPFAALDEITRFKLNNDLLALREKIGCTVIFVTHSVFESVFLSDRVVVMAARPGRVIEELTVDAPYPRSEAFRTSAEYARYCRLASNALHRATGEAA
ncbi:ABC transporter ATP-binding protein [Mameliella alba]|uniref:ABC transporter ATP-binding protein n=1 Tax=Mameliella alba TaxID=561184 RepID=UPI001ADAF395|nr:ABC transporter ATP-binding protein [Mameliella alba]